MDEVKGGLEVNSNHCVPLSLAHTHHQAVLGDTGIVDKYVDGAKLFLHLVDNLFGLSKVGSIGGKAYALNALGGNLSLGGLAVLIYHEIGECNVCAFFGKFQGNSLTNTTGSSGNECRLSF